jgi:hypothetical protein
MNVNGKALTIAFALAGSVGFLPLLIAATYNCPTLDPTPCSVYDSTYSCWGWCPTPGRDCTGSNKVYTNVLIHTLQSPGPYQSYATGSQHCFDITGCELSDYLDNQACQWDYNDNYCRNAPGSYCRECSATGSSTPGYNIDFTCSDRSS